MTKYFHFKFQKIIRDKMYGKMSESGALVDEKTLSTDEIMFFLKEKLLEEVLEVKNSANREELIEELADVLEVVDAILSLNNIQEQEVLTAKNEKYERSGGFNSHRLCLKIRVPEGHCLVEYCRKDPSKYPETSDV